MRIYSPGRAVERTIAFESEQVATTFLQMDVLVPTELKQGVGEYLTDWIN